MLDEESFIKVEIRNFLTKNPIIESIGYILVIIFSILTFLALIYDLYTENHKHTLKFGSEKFYKFFKKWYSKEGNLSIICDDLNWVVSEDGKHKEIFNTLKSKASTKSLDIFIKKSSNRKWEDQLEKAGANIYRAPENLVVAYSFSCISVLDNNSKVIVREKSKDRAGCITFVETNNNFVTPLLNSFLENIKKGEIKKHAKK